MKPALGTGEIYTTNLGPFLLPILPSFNFTNTGSASLINAINDDPHPLAIPLFPPWITVIVVTIRFPKPGNILSHEFHSRNPLGALPEIKPWYN